MKKTKFEQIKHFFSLIWLIIKLIWATLRNKWVWLAVAFVTWSYFLAWFSSNYEIKTSFKFGIYQRGTVKKASTMTVKASETIKPTPTPKLINKAFEEAYDTVWFNESNRGNDKTGLNGYCIKKGLLNEIGYAPHDNWCFVDREEQKATFMLWLQNRLDHKKMPYCSTIKECILFYTNQAYTI